MALLMRSKKVPSESAKLAVESGREVLVEGLGILLLDGGSRVFFFL